MDKELFLKAFSTLYEASLWTVTKSNCGLVLTYKSKGGYCGNSLCEDLFMLLRVSGVCWCFDLDAPSGQLKIKIY